MFCLVTMYRNTHDVKVLIILTYEPVFSFIRKKFHFAPNSYPKLNTYCVVIIHLLRTDNPSAPDFAMIRLPSPKRGNT
jgi:hypothetical protein